MVKVRITISTTHFLLYGIALLTGYFLYAQSITMVLALFLFMLLNELLCLVSLIPFIGALIQWLLITSHLEPFIFSLTPLYPTWLTDIIACVFLVFGIIMTMISTIVICLLIIGVLSL